MKYYKLLVLHGYQKFVLKNARLIPIKQIKPNNIINQNNINF